MWNGQHRRKDAWSITTRGGRNTKIHALADAKGRILAILLIGGEACVFQFSALR
jgi:hypothetical protein